MKTPADQPEQGRKEEVGQSEVEDEMAAARAQLKARALAKGRRGTAKAGRGAGGQVQVSSASYETGFTRDWLGE